MRLLLPLAVALTACGDATVCLPQDDPTEDRPGSDVPWGPGKCNDVEPVSTSTNSQFTLTEDTE